MDPYYVLLPKLREKRGLSQPRLYRETEGVSLDTIRALEKPPSQAQENGRRSRARYPSPRTLEALAKALDVEPTVFAEYRLARFRDQLDERVAGLDEAMRRLKEIEAALEETTREKGMQPPPAATDESPSQTAKRRTRRRGEGS